MKRKRASSASADLSSCFVKISKLDLVSRLSSDSFVRLNKTRNGDKPVLKNKNISLPSKNHIDSITSERLLMKRKCTTIAFPDLLNCFVKLGKIEVPWGSGGAGTENRNNSRGDKNNQRTCSAAILQDAMHHEPRDILSSTVKLKPLYVNSFHRNQNASSNHEEVKILRNRRYPTCSRIAPEPDPLRKETTCSVGLKLCSVNIQRLKVTLKTKQNKGIGRNTLTNSINTNPLKLVCENKNSNRPLRSLRGRIYKSRNSCNMHGCSENHLTMETCVVKVQKLLMDNIKTASTSFNHLSNRTCSILLFRHCENGFKMSASFEDQSLTVNSRKAKAIRGSSKFRSLGEDTATRYLKSCFVKIKPLSNNLFSKSNSPMKSKLSIETNQNSSIVPNHSDNFNSCKTKFVKNTESNITINNSTSTGRCTRSKVSNTKTGIPTCIMDPRALLKPCSVKIARFLEISNATDQSIKSPQHTKVFEKASRIGKKFLRTKQNVTRCAEKSSKSQTSSASNNMHVETTSIYKSCVIEIERLPAEMFLSSSESHTVEKPSGENLNASCNQKNTPPSELKELNVIVSRSIKKKLAGKFQKPRNYEVVPFSKEPTFVTRSYTGSFRINSFTSTARFCFNYDSVLQLENLRAISNMNFQMGLPLPFCIRRLYQELAQGTSSDQRIETTSQLCNSSDKQSSALHNFTSASKLYLDSDEFIPATLNLGSRTESISDCVLPSDFNIDAILENIKNETAHDDFYLDMTVGQISSSEGTEFVNEQQKKRILAIKDSVNNTGTLALISSDNQFCDTGIANVATDLQNVHSSHCDLNMPGNFVDMTKFSLALLTPSSSNSDSGLCIYSTASNRLDSMTTDIFRPKPMVHTSENIVLSDLSSSQLNSLQRNNCLSLFSSTNNEIPSICSTLSKPMASEDLISVEVEECDDTLRHVVCQTDRVLQLGQNTTKGNEANNHFLTSSSSNSEDNHTDFEIENFQASSSSDPPELRYLNNAKDSLHANQFESLGCVLDPGCQVPVPVVDSAANKLALLRAWLRWTEQQEHR